MQKENNTEVNDNKNNYKNKNFTAEATVLDVLNSNAKSIAEYDC